jgi:hypothetical protein
MSRERLAHIKYEITSTLKDLDRLTIMREKLQMEDVNQAISIIENALLTSTMNQVKFQLGVSETLTIRHLNKPN